MLSQNMVPKYAKIETPCGTVFNMVQKGKLYFLNNGRVGQHRSRSLKEWHPVLDHCNTRDLLRLENVVNGKKIGDRSNFQCKMCIQGKMVQTFNGVPDRRATKPLELVLCDLAGLISPETMGGIQYAANFVDDFSSVNIVYCNKNKSDTIEAVVTMEGNLSQENSRRLLQATRYDMSSQS